ncbi:MAG: YggS family pyridoxal phosphate-dependent enzyme [Chitinophagaceae bacterium]|nr:YggS family pyridoxal phosphate-dependent enzyme [Chitinophagaceae bacterium]
MAVDLKKYREIKTELDARQVQLVAVSKIKPVPDLMNLYEEGQRDFGENYVQELVDKQPQLPADTRWHFIGHLQSNKVKYLAPFIHLIHGVDSVKLLAEINKQAAKSNRVIHCLLQVHIAQEETKFGFDANELAETIQAIQTEGALSNVMIDGLMGMASFSDDTVKVRGEMKFLKELFDTYSAVKTSNCHFTILSMGMSGDYAMAIEEGSNMVRMGSLLFGARL